MNYTVFYSWQSDLENKYNRNFIEEVLDKAVKNISNNKDFSLEAFVDRDTVDVPGSPSIVESITGKIAKSDIFVCDVSIINNSTGGRPTPNPNVLFELGFASAILGWDRIIMIQNTAHGETDKLPFDLRGRRVMQYHLDANIGDKSQEKLQVQNNLTKRFEDALKYYRSNYFGSKEKVIWWGKWEYDPIAKVRGGTLDIFNVSSDAFFFDLYLIDGERNGGVHGKAQILTPHSAYARIKTPENEDCEIHFRRRLENNAWRIEVEEGAKCDDFHGMGASFTGTYQHKAEAIVSYGNIDEIDLNEIQRLVGKHLPAFLDNFQQVHTEKGEYGNDFIVAEAGVKGMYTMLESIIVLDKKGSIWCAYLDYKDDIVQYFTNANNSMDESPPAMKEWLSRFKEWKMVINGIMQSPIKEKKSFWLFGKKISYGK